MLSCVHSCSSSGRFAQCQRPRSEVVTVSWSSGRQQMWWSLSSVTALEVGLRVTRVATAFRERLVRFIVGAERLAPASIYNFLMAKITTLLAHVLKRW